MKIRYVLPPVQMAIAMALLLWNDTLLLASRRWCDMPGASPASRLLTSIDAPVALLSMAWDRYLSYPWNVAARLGAVGIFWYWVALNMEAWRERKEILMISLRPARWTLDVLLFLSGFVLGVIGAEDMYEVIRYAPFATRPGCFGPYPWLTIVPDATVACLLLGWSFVLVYFFSRDFVHSIRRSRPA
jgi:hypothetical protein